MSGAAKGDTVEVHYTGRLGDGTVFDSSEKRGAISFELGKRQMIPGFEKAVEGMEPGESKTATIPAADAYGPRLPQLTFTMPRAQLPADFHAEAGQVMRMQYRDGREMNVMITEVRDDVILMDGNHPLAGQDLTFVIELVKIG
jgi:peptidylprolyl isomerase